MREYNIRKRKSEYLPLLEEGNTFCCFDTETTGLEEEAKIIQFAAIVMTLTDGKYIETDRLNVYINPEEPLPEIITSITGITDEMLSDEQPELSVAKKIISILNNVDVWIGYNVLFDIKKLRGMSKRTNTYLDEKPYIDVLELARDFIDRSIVGNMKLETVTNYLLEEKKLSFHNAMDDVLATFGCYEVLIEKLQNAADVDTGNVTTHLVKAGIWKNPFKKEVRIKLTLSDGEPGDIYYDLFEHCWKCKQEPKVIRFFKSLDIADIEEQFLKKYAYPFEKETITEVGFSWLEYTRDK